MRISRKQVGDALNGSTKTINKAFTSSDKELADWTKRIFPIVASASREEMLRMIVLDILDRAFNHLSNKV